MQNYRLLGLGILVLGQVFGSAVEADAGVTYYSDSSSFEAAASGTLLTQTFNATEQSQSAGVGFSGPLDATDTGPLNAGAILQGLTVTTPQASQPGDLGLIGPTSSLGTIPLSLDNFAISNNRLGGLIVYFSPEVTAVSLNVIGLAADGGPANISVYSPTLELLSNTTLNIPYNSGSGQFLGIIASGGETIGSITLSNSNVVGIEQVQFNTNAAVPEPSSFAMLGTAVFGLVGAYRRRGSRIF